MIREASAWRLPLAPCGGEAPTPPVLPVSSGSTPLLLWYEDRAGELRLAEARRRSGRWRRWRSLDGGGRGLQPGRRCVPGTPALQELLRASQVEGGGWRTPLSPLPSPSWSLLRLALLQALSGSCILSYQALPTAGTSGTLDTEGRTRGY